jgi:hypothetical protein
MAASMVKIGPSIKLDVFGTAVTTEMGMRQLSQYSEQ